MVDVIQSGPLLDWHKKRLEYLEPFVKDLLGGDSNEKVVSE